MTGWTTREGTRRFMGDAPETGGLDDIGGPGRTTFARAGADRADGPDATASTRSLRDQLAAVVVTLALLAAPLGGAFAADTPASTDLPDLAPIRAKVYAKDYQSAADDLRALTATVKHADVYNLLGFSLRNLGQYDEAAKWYREALYYDPDHRNAIEYQGELFIRTGQLQRAKNNVQKLEFLCLKGCVELTQLRQAVAAAEKR